MSPLISSSDNKKILLTTRNVRLDSGRYATKYYWGLGVPGIYNFGLLLFSVDHTSYSAIIRFLP